MPLVHCINLPSRTDRRASAEKQAQEQGFRIQFWDGITASKNKRHTNISQAHKQIVRRAKESKIPSVLIMEDDCIFTHPSSFNYFISQKPKHYDLYMGLIYAGFVDENHRVLRAFSGGLTLYSIRSNFYDIFLSADETDHIDRWCGKRGEQQRYYVCDPMVVVQSGGYSDNMRRVMNYDAYELGKRFYKG